MLVNQKGKTNLQYYTRIVESINAFFLKDVEISASAHLKEVNEQQQQIVHVITIIEKRNVDDANGQHVDHSEDSTIQLRNQLRYDPTDHKKGELILSTNYIVYKSNYNIGTEEEE